MIKWKENKNNNLKELINNKKITDERNIPPFQPNSDKINNIIRNKNEF
jgi:hypothetical protein